LSKIHVNTQALLKSINTTQFDKKCCPQVSKLIGNVGVMSNISLPFINFYRDLNAIVELVQSLDDLNCVDVCETFEYFPHFNKIAFPCNECCFSECEFEHQNKHHGHCDENLLPLNVYPVAFIMWVIYIIGRILACDYTKKDSKCNENKNHGEESEHYEHEHEHETDSSSCSSSSNESNFLSCVDCYHVQQYFTVGLMYVMELNSLMNAYDQIGRVRSAMQFLPQQLKNTNKHHSATNVKF